MLDLRIIGEKIDGDICINRKAIIYEVFFLDDSNRLYSLTDSALVRDYYDSNYKQTVIRENNENIKDDDNLDYLQILLKEKRIEELKNLIFKIIINNKHFIREKE